MKRVGDYIVAWLNQYCKEANQEGFVIGVSGGVDSALSSTLCALTERKVLLVSMPILHKGDQLLRAHSHIQKLCTEFENVSTIEIDLSLPFTSFKTILPENVSSHSLSMANTQARLRMTCLYALAQSNQCLVVGTGNKVEDFGVGFYTKYGDGGVDLSPIAGLTKTQVWNLAKELDVLQEIIDAKPTDGLWETEKTDEEQIGASYPELEWAMEYGGDGSSLTIRELEVLSIYHKLNAINKHKMVPIPICTIPKDLF